ncbi:MAG: hypothetical protein JST75_04440 [Bacteroidetes bacterium]|nr:hypothetical protein [Bacteroidota bacterium]
MRKNISIAGHSRSKSFNDFIFREKKNNRYFFIAAALTIFQFVIFKLLYPFPDFFSDSYSYIYAASAHLDISIWPIGYSKFLAAFHAITHSDTALIFFQYFFLEISAIYFFFSILYFYNPGKTTIIVLFIFLFCNPLFLYISNYVNSDPLFAAISLIWITQLLWIIHSPHISQIFIQATLLFLAFTIRNNAYYYPFIAVLAFILSKHKPLIKLIGSVAGLLLIIPFVIHSRNESLKITGTKQFSLFTGWQLANNALYIYDKIKVDSTQWQTAETKELDRISRQFFKTIPKEFNYRKYLDNYVGNYFIRQPEAPLKQYLWRHYKIVNDSTQIIGWGKSSVVFSEFGTRIIKQHPISFARYFMLPNAKNYFLPPLEKLEIYNLGLENVPIVVQDWFDYKTNTVWSASNKIQSYILFLFPPIFLVINVFFAGSLIWFFIKKYYLKTTREVNYTLLLCGIFLLSNFCFTVFATINVFRYQFLPMIVCLTTLLLMMEWLEKKQILLRPIDNLLQSKKERLEWRDTALKNF